MHHKLYIKMLLMVLAVGLFGMNMGCGGQPTAATTSETDTLELPTSELTILSVIDGTVLVKKAGSEQWLAGEEGITISGGDRIKTEAGSSATVVFFEGSTIDLDEGTEVEVQELGRGEGNTTIIRLWQEVGTTISQVTQLADPASRYEIETPAAIAAVRGTTMYVRVAADGTTTVRNIEGIVVIIVKGVETEIPAGEERVIEPEPLPETTTTPVEGQPTTSPPTTTPAPITGIGLNGQYEPPVVWVWDTITFIYWVFNTGEVGLTGITVTDDIGTPVYTTGDDNDNGILDPGEIWKYASELPTEMGGPDEVTSHVTVTATGTNDQYLTNDHEITVTVRPFHVLITWPDDNDTFTEPDLVLTGRVSDPSIIEVDVIVNGDSQTVSVIDKQFSASITLSPGENTVRARVQLTESSTASTLITLYYEV